MMMGKSTNMISVRTLLRQIRTHSVAAIVGAVTLATVLFACTAAHFAGTIEVDASGIAIDTSGLEAKLSGELAAWRRYADEMRLDVEELRLFLDSIQKTLADSDLAVQTIERVLNEVAGMDASVKRSFGDVMEKIDRLETDLADAYRHADALEAQIAVEAPADVAAHRAATEEESAVLNAAAATVAEHYALLGADVSVVTEELHACEVNAATFDLALRTIEESFGTGIGEVRRVTLALKENGVEVEDTTMHMLAQVKMELNQVDALTESVDASRDDIGALRDEIEQSSRMIEDLQAQISASNERIHALTGALEQSATSIDALSGSVGSMKSEMETMRTHVDDAAQSGQAARDAAERMERAQAEQAARGEDYLTVSFSFNIAKEQTSYTFDLSPYVANYQDLKRDDILVRSFGVYTSGEHSWWMGVGASMSLDNAYYDASSGTLVVTQRMLTAPFGSQAGSVTFAVLGGIAP